MMFTAEQLKGKTYVDLLRILDWTRGGLYRDYQDIQRMLANSGTTPYVQTRVLGNINCRISNIPNEQTRPLAVECMKIMTVKAFLIDVWTT